MRYSRARFTSLSGEAIAAARAVVLGVLLIAGGGFPQALAQSGSVEIPQFDIFPGLDRVVREGNWFPVVCEVRNEGPSFMATIEFRDEAFGNDLVRRIPIELPTGTLKRFSFPMFCASRWGGRYAATLRDENGRVVANQGGITPRAQISWTSPLLVAIPASAAGMPAFPETPNRNNYGGRPEPTVARVQPEMFPDNPIALEGVDALYLNSQRAVDLREPQVEALMSWLHAGGELFLGVDAVLDVNGVPWLKSIVPGEIGSPRTVPVGTAFDGWLQNGPRSVTPLPLISAGDRPYRDLRPEETFSEANLRLHEIDRMPGSVLELSIDDAPAIVSHVRGRGRVTVLLFNPELEPLRSWKHRPWFWARLANLSGAYFEGNQTVEQGGYGIDGVLGAIVDSRQVRKLPVSALLLLLVAYLVIIGPFDQWWLKKINRQMLTWITFPCYVVLFSALIWVIGYKLRAGESEWNELQIVDVIPKGEGAELRGESYASVYSPVNYSYAVAGHGRFAALRSEYGGTAARGGLDGRVRIEGDTFAASVSVPVWTSQMLVGSWVADAALPFTITLRKEGERYEASVTNRDLPGSPRAWIALEGHLYDLEFPVGGQTATTSLSTGKTQIRSFVTENSRQFGLAAQQRQQALGQDTARHQIDPDKAAVAISLASLGDASTVDQWGQVPGRFQVPGRLDASGVLADGFGLVFVWLDDYAASPPMNDFTPKRSSNSTLLRLAVPLNSTVN